MRIDQTMGRTGENRSTNLVLFGRALVRTRRGRWLIRNQATHTYGVMEVGLIIYIVGSDLTISTGRVLGRSA
jgi:hypothetical protein